jgi:hypothetical protein
MKDMQSLTFPGLDGKYSVAPGGYGYGEIPVDLGSTTNDSAFLVKLNEQFAKTVSRTRMVRFTRNGNAWVGTLWNAGNGYGVLTAYSYNGYNSAYFSKLVRNCKNGVWQDWEYENPPMKNNTEYLTTERWNGKPVYRQLVVKSFSNDVGNADGLDGVIFSHNIYFVNIVRANIAAASGDFSYTFNMKSARSAGYGGVVANGFFNIELQNMSIASPTFYVDISYVKE